MDRIYLDNAATTPLDPEVFDAMLPFMKESYGNPSAVHSFGRESRAAIEKARKVIANYLNASTGEIFFTSGGTESNNLAIKCGIYDLGMKRFITSKIEHHCILHTLEHYEELGMIHVEYVNLKKDGHVDLEHLNQLLEEDERQAMVCLMHVNNEIGNILDIEETAAICKMHNALFLTDSVQAIGLYPTDVQKSKIHFMSGAGHKLHGPKGIGFVYVNADLSVKPLLLGGSQERNMRAGTEYVYGIVGFGKAVEIAHEKSGEVSTYVQGLKDYMITLLRSEIPGIQFNGDVEGRSSYKVLNVAFPKNEKTDLLLFNLDINGIAASGGSACSSGATKGSHVLEAINSPENTTSIRFSFSKFNTKEEIERVVEKLKELTLVEAAV